MDTLSEMSEHMVRGRTLVPMGKVAGRMVYQLTSQGETWRFTPDVHAFYLLRRVRDGSYRDFASLEAAVAYVEDFERRTDDR